jgi:hypothetical protein
MHVAGEYSTSWVLTSSICSLGWCNTVDKYTLALYIAHIHAACYVTTNLKFRSCTALSSSSPVDWSIEIKNCHCQSISAIETRWLVASSPDHSHVFNWKRWSGQLGTRLVACTLCTHYIDDLLSYAPRVDKREKRVSNSSIPACKSSFRCTKYTCIICYNLTRCYHKYCTNFKVCLVTFVLQNS